MKKIKIGIGMALAGVLLSTSAFAAGDPAAGEKIIKTRCVICHNAAAGAPAKVGPNLFGVVGRGPGKFPSFAYSNAFKAAVAKGFAWNDQTLDAYLTNPTNFLHATSGDASSGSSKMTFMLPSADDRANAIAYLNTLK